MAVTKSKTNVAEALEKALESATPEQVEILTPEAPAKRDWWQVFRCSLTKFEIPVVLVIKCREVREGQHFLGLRALNSIEGASWEDTYRNLSVALAGWQAEFVPEVGKDYSPGDLIHYRLSGKTWTPRNGTNS